MISFKHKGDFSGTENFMKRAQRVQYRQILEKYADEGVRALAAATPVDTGKTASSWGYKLNVSKTQMSISWSNSHIIDGVPIAIILQYGHGTKNGGYVSGIDYINPAIKPILDKIADNLWKEVTRL